MLFHCLPLLRGRKLPCLLKDSLLIIPAHWHRITTFWEPERQPQPHGQGDVLPALQLCCSHYGFTTLGTCLTCSVIQIPGILRDLESPALPQKPDNSTISPSNKFTLLKFLFLAIMLACNSLSCILLGCLCASNFPPSKFPFGCFPSSPFLRGPSWGFFLFLFDFSRYCVTCPLSWGSHTLWGHGCYYFPLCSGGHQQC